MDFCFREWMLYGFFAPRKRRMYHKNQALGPTKNSYQIHATFMPPFIPPFKPTISYHSFYHNFYHSNDTEIRSNIHAKIYYKSTVKIYTIGRHRAPYGFRGLRKLPQGRAKCFGDPSRSIEFRKVPYGSIMLDKVP